MNPTIKAFADQSVACAALGSPFMGRLMGLFAERLAPTKLRRCADEMLTWPGDPAPSADNVPLRIAGGLHALKLSGLALNEVYPPNEASDDALWDAVVNAMDRFDDRLTQALSQPPQTNEVRRSAVILPVLCMLAERWKMPLNLMELGCSGGLNLRADLFALDLEGTRYGDPASKVVLTPDWTGPMPPKTRPEVTRRSGVDLAPIDPTSAEGALRLLSYLWPDQADRLARTRAAIDIAQGASATLAAGDAADLLAHALKPKANTTGRLVFHTVAAQYFNAETAKKVDATLDAAGRAASAQAPLARLGMEADGGCGAGLTLTLWPEGDTHSIGRADFHGRWVNWTGLS